MLVATPHSITLMKGVEGVIFQRLEKPATKLYI